MIIIIVLVIVIVIVREGCQKCSKNSGLLPNKGGRGRFEKKQTFYYIFWQPSLIVFVIVNVIVIVIVVVIVIAPFSLGHFWL